MWLTATLERRTATDDINPMEAATVPRKQISVHLGVTEEEARDAILHTSNTAPGADGITVQVL